MMRSLALLITLLPMLAAADYPEPATAGKRLHVEQLGDSYIYSGLIIQLAWNVNPDDVNGYILYYGKTPDLATNDLVKLERGNEGYSHKRPSYEFDALTIGFQKGDVICFRLTAFNADSQSGFSSAVCGVI